MRKISFFLSSVIALTCCFAFSFAVATPAQALVVETQKEKVVISGTPVGESVVAIGKDVEITTDINGDVYCAGQSVRISGNVSGDVLCAAKDLEITGAVEGSVRSAGQRISIQAPVDHTVTIAGQDLTLSTSSLIGSELIAAGENVVINGAVDGKMSVWGQNVTVNGEINGDAMVKAKQLSVGDEAVLRGTLSYQGPQQATVATQAKVEKPIAFVQTTPEPKATKPERTVRSGVGKAISSAIMMVLAGIVIAYLFPGFVNRTKTTVMTLPLQSMGVGLLVLIGGPILGVIMIFTLVGIPLALVWFLVWILLLVVSFVPVAAWLGEKASTQFSIRTTAVGAMVIGCLILAVIGVVPVLGKLVDLVVALAGTGAMVMSFSKGSQKKR